MMSLFSIRILFVFVFSYDALPMDDTKPAPRVLPHPSLEVADPFPLPSTVHSTSLAASLPETDNDPYEMENFIDSYYESYESLLAGEIPQVSPDHEFFHHLPSLKEPPVCENTDPVDEDMPDVSIIVTPEHQFYAPSPNKKKKVEKKKAAVVFMPINDTTTIADLFHEFGFGYNGGRALVKVAEEENIKNSRDHTHKYEMCIRYEQES
jgi:hypothetical protein